MKLVQTLIKYFNSFKCFPRSPSCRRCFPTITYTSLESFSVRLWYRARSISMLSSDFAPLCCCPTLDIYIYISYNTFCGEKNKYGESKDLWICELSHRSPPPQFHMIFQFSTKQKPFGYDMVCIYVRTLVHWKFRSSGDGNENNGNVDEWIRPADNE